ncbi:MAG TPA: cation transporter dimerization domain-containing protein, partial [Polyangiales bacterium]|nr:cation transporter dimerization domain-containing protein [Polyangiales bacterium]
AVQRALPGSDVVVHVEPRRSGLDLRDRVLDVALREPLVREVHDVAIYEHDERVSVSLHLKFPRDTPLPTALASAERVERAINSDPEVAVVQTHLEPLEQPLRARCVAEHHPDADGAYLDAREIKRIVERHTSTEPSAVELLDTEVGRIVFLTLAVAADTTLVSAHRLSSEVEDELRARMPEIADVVVHTEICE